MGYIILGVAATCFFIKLPGHAALLWGSDQPELQVHFSAGAGGERTKGRERQGVWLSAACKEVNV